MTRLLVVGPGASFSTADVEAGLVYGLEQQGVVVTRYQLGGRLMAARQWLHNAWRHVSRSGSQLPKPTPADVSYHAASGTLERALARRVEGVIVVAGLLFHPRILQMLQQAGLPVAVLLTESPYEEDRERTLVSLANLVWTTERTSVPVYASLCPHVHYLPHAWHPQRHRPGEQPGDEALPAHDVVFVGTGFPERVAFFSAINWDGIDLGLYGHWLPHLGSRSKLRRYVRANETSNAIAAGLYRRARVGLNLYRTTRGWGLAQGPLMPGLAESLSPRAYELAACGVVHVSDARPEVSERFGALVPQFTTPAEAETALRQLLASPLRCREIATALPAAVAHDSWIERAGQVLDDLQQLQRPRRRRA